MLTRRGDKLTVNRFELKDRFGETYSGADMNVYMAFPGHVPLWMGTASTVSYTTYREKKQVRTMGRINAAGITKGPRTISGRLIFTVLAEHIVESIRREIPYLQHIRTILMDELPPFDILVSFGNEYGHGAGLVIQGVTTVDEQKVLSVEDLFSENIFTYLARDLEPMRDIYATEMDKPYEPLSWYTYNFRDNTEGVAKFKVDELMVHKESLLLQDPQPFIGGPEEWDSSAAPTMEVTNPVLVGGGDKGGSGGGTPTDPGGGFDQKGGPAKLIVQVHRNNSAQNPIEGAEVRFVTFTGKTDAKGQSEFMVTPGEFDVVAVASGYQDSKPKRVKITASDTIVYVRIPMDLPVSSCSGADKIKTGEIRPFGYWYEHGATTHVADCSKENGEPQFFPNPSVQVFNPCNEPVPNTEVAWMYEIVNWAEVRDNRCWGKNSGHESDYAGKVDFGTGKMNIGFTNEDGKLTMDDFNFQKFPDGAYVKVIAKAATDNTNKSYSDSKLWPVFHFNLWKLNR